MATRKPKTTVNDYKDRMTSPFGAVLTNPKTRKPVKSGKKKGK